LIVYKEENLFAYTWHIPASTPERHAAVALMTGCEALSTMYRIGWISWEWSPSGNPVRL